ncbi:type II secretion system F family protein [Candidatus Woesearchaeota archaeon]|nr:type II secretion system F family protein [Candidatus Woesearchaeota archaeon]
MNLNPFKNKKEKKELQALEDKLAGRTQEKEKEKAEQKPEELKLEKKSGEQPALAQVEKKKKWFFWKKENKQKAEIKKDAKQDKHETKIAKAEARIKAAEKSKQEEKEIEDKIKKDKSLSKKFNQLKSLKSKDLFKKKKKKFSIRGFVKVISLQNYLEKAGLENTDAKQAAKKIFMIDIVLCLILTALVIILNIYSHKGLANLFIFLIGFWLTAFFLILALIWVGYLFYLDMKIFRRTRAVEEVFPDFLQLASSNISAGMPIDRALWYAVRPGFGVLAKEIETVAKNTMAGEDLGVALTNFADKYESKTIKRSISLLLEGMAAGGEMADLLNKISLDIEETKILKKEMAANVTTYVIFIIFATIIAAPVLFALATQLLVIIQGITSKLGTTSTVSSSMFAFSFSGNSIKLSDFRLFSYLMLIISSLSSAAIVSVIKKGRVKEGISSIPSYIVVSVILYTIASILIKGMFSGFF